MSQYEPRPADITMPPTRSWRLGVTPSPGDAPPTGRPSSHRQNPSPHAIELSLPIATSSESAR